MSNQSVALFRRTREHINTHTHTLIYLTLSHLHIYRFNDDYDYLWFRFFFYNVITMTLSSFERKQLLLFKNYYYHKNTNKKLIN